MKSHILLLIIFLFPALTLANGNPVRIQIGAEPNTLDPLHVSDVLGFNIISNVVEGLVRLDGKGKLQNGLAASYRILDAGKIYRFRLREDAKWSDGKPVTVEDFIFGITLALDPKTGARDATLLQAIEGASPFQRSKLGIKKSGKDLEIKLAKPDSSFLQALTMPLASPRRKDIWEKNGEKWKPEDPSTGAYRVSTHKPDREIRLEPNRPGLLPIQFKIIPEETTALNLFETKGIDLITAIPTPEIARLEKLGFLRSSPSAATFYLSFHLEKPPFSDIRWRKALAYAVDRENLKKLQPQSFTPTSSFIPAGLEGFFPYETSKFEKEWNWAKSQKPLEVHLVYASNALLNNLMERLQSDLQKNLNLKIKLEPMEWKAYLGRLQGSAPSLFFMGYSAPFQDPMSHLKIFLSREADNRSKFQSAKYDALVAKVSTERGTERRKAIEAAHKILVTEEVVIVPLLARQQLHGVSERLEGFEVNPFGVMDLRKLHWK